MTFSILAIDRKTGEIGGGAATGSLCVGGWVLRADPRAGASASQGAAPSTFWGEDVLTEMRGGAAAKAAVAAITEADSGRAARQLAALDRAGGTGSFTGADNTPARGARAADGVVVTGNLLNSEDVLDAVLAGFQATESPLPQRLLAALDAGAAAGGDSRGLMSAALHVVSPRAAPLTLRIDWSGAPLPALRDLLARAQSGAYAAWLPTVPVLTDRSRRGP